MLASKGLLDIYFLSFLAFALVNQPTDAGLTSYLPSLRVLNPYYWFANSNKNPSMERLDNQTILAGADNVTRNRFDGIPVKFISTTVKPYWLDAPKLNKGTISSDKNLATVTHTTPVVSKASTTRRPSTNITDLFTRKPARKVKVTINKKGKLYETSMNPDTSTYKSHSEAFDTDSKD